MRSGLLSPGIVCDRLAERGGLQDPFNKTAARANPDGRCFFGFLSALDGYMSTLAARSGFTTASSSATMPMPPTVSRAGVQTLNTPAPK